MINHSIDEILQFCSMSAYELTEKIYTNNIMSQKLWVNYYERDESPYFCQQQRILALIDCHTLKYSITNKLKEVYVFVV